jgi:hypothetical protein
LRTTGSPSRVRIALSAGRALQDPVIICLLLAGFFDGISGNPIHSTLLFSTALALALDRGVRLRREIDPADVAADRGAASALRTDLSVEDDGIPNTVLRAVAVTGAFMYAVVVGGFARYSWPATFAVLVPGALALTVAWRGPFHPRLEPGPLDPLGTITWGAIVVALSGWELQALFLQPTLSTDSYAHPTISFLTDAGLASHLGRSIALLAWLALGWFLLER